MYSTKTDSIRFAIGVWDAHAGLSEDEALVARKDATFPLLKREDALTTDNATEWFGAGPPTPPPAAAAPLATAPTRPRHVHGPVVDAKNNQCGDERISTRTRVFLKAGRAHVLPEAHGAGCDTNCLPNSGTKTKELHGARHPPVRDVSEREREREAKELHGEHHPPVAIRFGAEPLVASGQGRMELRFRVVGAVIGFKYRIVLQEADILVHRVIQQQEISFSLIDDSASNEITAELVELDGIKTDLIKFAIGVWDAHAGLSEDEALVARKDATFPRLKSEVLILKSQIHSGLT
jgi:hypothetical protein